MSDQKKRTRVPIEQRREQVLEAALTEFSHKGLHGGSTMAIAAQVGISQPNIFRIYPTKHQLFVAALERVFSRVEATMLAAGERDIQQPLATMSEAWGTLMEDRENMLMLLQGYSASEDPAIQELMRNWSQRIFERMETLPGVGEDRAHDFFAAGMFYMVAAAMDLPARSESDEWAKRFLDTGS